MSLPDTQVRYPLRQPVPGVRVWRLGAPCSRHILLALLLVVVLAGCQGIAVESPQPVTITIAGATAMRPVLQELTAAFTARHPNVLFDLRGGGSSLGEEQARAGMVALGASTMPQPVDEATDTPVADGLLRIPIGIDGIAVVVHATTDVTGLSLVQLRDLYAGEVIDWLQLGEDEGEVLLVSREEGSGARRAFESTVMGDRAVSLTAVVMPTSADVVEYVSDTPQTIGYVSRAFLGELPDQSGAVDTPAGVRVLPVEGALPTNNAVAARRYPLVQPLYLVSSGQPTGRVRQFVDFVLSPAGQAIVARYHSPIR